MNSAATVLGFIIGPAFALALNFVNFTFHNIVVNDYTSPGYLSAILSIFSILSLVMLKEIPTSAKKAKKPITGRSGTYGSGFYAGAGSVKDVSQLFKMTKQHKIPVLPVSICLFSYFAYTTSFTVFETIGTPYTQKAFGWGVFENSVMFMILGVICVISLMVLQFFVRCMNDRILLIGATALSVAGFAILFDWHAQFITKPRFWIGVSFCSASYATSVAVLISVYSKVLENLDQGMMMGWLSSSGSLARIVGPVVASNALQYGGSSGFVVFILMISFMGVTTLVVIASYKVLIPRGTTVSVTKSPKTVES